MVLVKNLVRGADAEGREAADNHPQILSPTANDYRPDIDGLRAVAVLLVVMFHAFPNTITGGYVGVDVFFVISGFLITRIITSDLERDSYSIGRFYVRRIRRIFPSLIIVLAASLIGGYFFLLPLELQTLGLHAAAGTAFVPNLLLLAEVGYFDQSAEYKPLLHLWSLGIEEQFYLLWPLLLSIFYDPKRPIWRLSALIVAATAASFAANLWLTESSPATAFYLPVTRAWELFAGALLAVFYVKANGGLMRVNELVSQSASLVGVALILGAAWWLQKDSAFPGWRAAIPVLGTTLMIVAGPDAIANRLLSQRAIVAVGLISYPIYLWHWPLLSFANILEVGQPSIALRLAAVLAAMVLSAATFLVIEGPLRKGGLTYAKTAGLLVAMCMVGMTGLGIYFERGLPNRFPAEIQTILAYQNYEFRTDARVPACWLKNDAPFTDFAPECFLRSAEPSNQRVVVWGDSHAARLYPGVRSVMKAETDIGQFTRDSCPPLLDFGSFECRTSNASIVSGMRQSPPDLAILYGNWTAYQVDPTALEQALAKTVAELKASGIPSVIVIGPFPNWKAPLPGLVYRDWILSTRGALPDRITDSHPANLEETDRAIERAAEDNGAGFVSMRDALCNSDGCLVHVPAEPQKLLTWDYGHLTTEGASFVAGCLLDLGNCPVSEQPAQNTPG